MNLGAYDDAVEACAEVELDMLPGEAIRHQNDLIVDLLEALSETFEMIGSRLLKDTFGYDWHEKAAAAIAKAKGES